MPKLNFVKSARKDNPVAKKGESYYWWQFRNGSKQYSKERPKRSQLTTSSYLATVWHIQDDFNLGDKSTMEDNVQEIIDSLQTLMDECQDNLDNMPEQLQETSDAGTTLQERIDALDNCISNLESIDFDATSFDDVEEEVRQYIDELG